MGHIEVCPHMTNANIVICKWIFSLKYRLDGSIVYHNARLVALDFAQAYGIDYMETFSPVVWLNFIWVLLSSEVHRDWSLHNWTCLMSSSMVAWISFIEQPLGFVVQEESS